MNYLSISKFKVNSNLNILSSLILFLIIKEYISHLEIKLFTSLDSNVTQRVKRDINSIDIFIKKTILCDSI